MVKLPEIKMFNTPEDEIDFNSFMKFSAVCYNYVLFDFKPLSENASWIERIRHFGKVNFFRFCIACFCVAETSLVAFSILIASDFVEASANVPNVVTVVLIIVKAVVNLVRRKDIWILFGELQGIFDTRNGENAKYKIKEYLDGYHNFIKAYGLTILFVFLPIAMPVVNFLIYGTMKLTVNYWFPFEAFIPENFPFALAWVLFIAYNCLVQMLAADALLYALITVVAMEFDILKLDLVNLKFSTAGQRLEKFNHLILRHNKLLDIGDQLQDIYGITFLLTFGISSLVLCFVAFHLSTAADLAAYAFYVPYMCMICGQVLLLCVFGQKLFNSSEEVADGIYTCDWEQFKDETFKKEMILMILRSRRAKKLTAMNFADVSLPSFTTVS